MDSTGAKQLQKDKNLLTRIDEFGKGLNDYEKGFLDSCLKQVEAGRSLSEKQRALAEKLDEDHVA